MHEIALRHTLTPSNAAENKRMIAKRMLRMLRMMRMLLRVCEVQKSLRDI